MKKHIEKMTDDELKNWLIINARRLEKTSLTMLIAEEIIKRSIFNPKIDKI